MASNNSAPPSVDELFPDQPTAALPHVDDLFPDVQGRPPQVGAAPAASSAPAAVSVPPWYSPQGVLRHAAQLQGAGAEGLAGFLGIPGDLEVLGQKYLPAGHNWPFPDDFRAFPTGAELEASLDKLGAKGRRALGVPDNYLAPQGIGERYSTAAARGAGSSLPLVPFMGPGAALMSGAGGGLGGQAGEDLFPGSVAAPIIGGAIGGGIGQSVVNTLGRRSLQAIGAALGDSTTYQQAGEGLQAGARNWLKVEHPTLQGDAWAPVDAAVPSSTPVPATAFTAALQKLKRPAGAFQPLADLMQSSMADKMLGAMNNSTLALGQNATWQDAKTFRTILGEAMTNPQITKDLSQTDLKTLYGALTSDMRTAAHAAGAGDLFDAANAESKHLFGIAEGPMAKLVKSADPSPADPTPETAALKLISSAKKGGSDLASLRAVLPQEVDDLAAAHLAQPTAAFHKLSPEGQAALIDNDKLRSAAVTASKAAAGQSAAQGATDALHSIVGGTVGRSLGTIAGHALGLQGSDLIAPETGELLGLGAGHAIAAGRNVVRNPATLAGPLVGAEAGSEDAPLPDLVVRRKPAGQ